ncbi:MAG TPA: hypothetical protein V6D26_17790 [Stenomitos sp.]
MFIERFKPMFVRMFYPYKFTFRVFGQPLIGNQCFKGQSIEALKNFLYYSNLSASVEVTTLLGSDRNLCSPRQMGLTLLRWSKL